LAWARRELALLLVAGDSRKEAAALALIDRNRQDQREAVADGRARAFVRASRPSQRRQALRDLEQTVALRVLSPEEKYRLAKLYEAENDWLKAQAQLLSLLETDPRNPVYLAHHIAGLFQRGETDAVRVWLPKLERIEPDSARTRDFRNRLKGLAGEKG
jgi:hypothetical protein